MIGPSCVVDVDKLEKELKEVEDMIKELGINLTVRDRVYISNAAHIITPEAIEEDIRTDKVGTTKRGIGPTFARKALRIGHRVEDVMVDGKLNGCKVVDSYQALRDTTAEHITVLLEGAQGFGLDIDLGDYPYVTSSNCTVGLALNVGIPFQALRYVYGVCKIYETYLGAKEFQPKDDEALKQLQIVGEEKGATTGRPRECNWIKVEELLKAIAVNGVTHLVVNKNDIMDKVGTFKYYVNGELKESSSLDDMQSELKEYIDTEKSVEKIYWSSSPSAL
jgi:adenylosuccinate synthase